MHLISFVWLRLCGADFALAHQVDSHVASGLGFCEYVVGLIFSIFPWVFGSGHFCYICLHWGVCGNSSHHHYRWWPAAFSAWNGVSLPLLEKSWCGASPGYSELGDVQHRACCGGWLPDFCCSTVICDAVLPQLVKKGAAPQIGRSSRIRNGIQYGRFTLRNPIEWFEPNHYSFPASTDVTIGVMILSCHSLVH